MVSGSIVRRGSLLERSSLSIGPGDALRKPFAGNAQLANLCRLTPTIKWGHVQLLITIADAKERRKTQKEAAKHGWTHRELSHQLASWPGRRASGGRPAKVPTSSKAALLQLVADCKQWRRRWETVAEGKGPESNAKLGSKAKELAP